MVSGLAYRLFDLSFVEHAYYVKKAQEQQSIELGVFPRRGEIWVQDASAGRPSIVAESVPSYVLSATPVNVTHKKEYAHLLATVTNTDEQTILTGFENGTKYMNPIKHGLSKDQVEQIAGKVNDLERQWDSQHQNVSVNFDASQQGTIYFIGGLYFMQEYERVYPEGALLSQVLGFVNDHGTGQYGFEGQYDAELSGYAGKVVLEKDGLATLLNQEGAVAGHDGTNYELTIDRNVQFVVEQDLQQSIKDTGAVSGSVIVMDPKNGDIIAMANAPSYDPNNFRDVKSEDIGVFDNPSVSSMWEPGSIFKPLIMAAAVDTGLVTAKTQDTFPESVTVDGHKIETALRKSYGTETMSQVLANSDNVAMVWVANKLGNQNMYAYLKKFGFGDYTGIDLKNEAAGSILPVSQWRDINRATMSFGQGIAVTPLQVAAAYSAIANNGRLIKPHLVKAIIDENGVRHEEQPIEGEQVIKPETAQSLKDMMVYTVVSAHNRAGTPGYKIGGKTGTAQIPDPKNGGYLADAYNHSFVGIGPSDDPKYVMLVKIDHPDLQKVGGIFAESTAVPLFGKISSFLLSYYQIKPTNR